MPFTRTWVAATLVCLLPCGLRAGEPEAGDFTEAVRLIDTWLDAQRDYDRLPGLSVGIVRDQELLWSKGYGMADIERKVPADPGTVYSICSISKLFTSIAIMQLRDAGKLRLDDPVATVLSGFDLEQNFADSGPITVRSLLTHSSGLPRESDFAYWTGPDFPFPTRDQVREKLGEQATLYPASTYFQYSNLGLTLLGEIVAERTGISYEAYVEKHILEPLRLNETQPRLPESLWRGKLAAGYSALRRDGSRKMLPLFQARGIAAAAGFSSNVEDLARFASWQFRVLETDDDTILKPSTLKEMHRVHWIDPNWKTAWGLGFSITKYEGRTLVGHGGSCPGYRTSLMLDPKKKLAFIVMINAQGSNPSKYFKGMQAILKKAAEDGKKEDVNTTVDLETYAGLYDLQPWSGELAVTPWQGKLAVIRLPSDNPAENLTLLNHVEADTFRRVRDDESLGEDVVFERDDAGNVTRMRQHSNYRKKLR